MKVGDDKVVKQWDLNEETEEAKTTYLHSSMMIGNKQNNHLNDFLCLEASQRNNVYLFEQDPLFSFCVFAITVGRGQLFEDVTTF